MNVRNVREPLCEWCLGPLHSGRCDQYALRRIITVLRETIRDMESGGTPLKEPWDTLEPAFFSEDPERHAKILEASGGEAVFKNNRYQVLTRRLADDGTMMLSVKRNDRLPIHDWRDLQRIKNEMVGPEREAFEIFPAETRRVDAANQYYLWVLPEGVRIPLGFNERLVFDGEIHGTRQRPFDDPAISKEAVVEGQTIPERFLDHLQEHGIPLFEDPE